MEFKNMTLEALASGKLEEQFQAALLEVAENIDDPERKLDVSRKIKIEIGVKPVNEERRECLTTMTVTVTLAGKNPITSPTYVVRDAKGRYSVKDTDMRQATIDEAIPGDGETTEDGDPVTKH